MNCIFRWAQFSDIHFQTKSPCFNTKLLRDDLPSFLEENVAKCDAMILSGDFRFAKDNEDNPQRVIEYIGQLMRSLGIDSSSNVFTVPGNHDLNRSNVQRMVAQKTQSEYDPNKGIVEKDVLESLLSYFTFYNKMHEMLKDGSKWSTENPHCLIELKRCNLLLLNTALTACCDEDHERLIVGSSFIDSLICNCNKTKPIIAVGHHSIKELSPYEQKAITKYFDQKNIKLYLCGHSHEQWFDSFGESGREITVGCMMQTDNSVTACFGVGELMEDGSVKYSGYKWDIDQKTWFECPTFRKEYSSLYSIISEEKSSIEMETTKKLEKISNPFTIMGYSLLGPLGSDGIKYYWKKSNTIIESIAMNRRLKNSTVHDDMKTSAYTISTSLGCVLSSIKSQCLFCGTGKKPYGGELKPEDIALQCIFMAEYDSNCTSYPLVKDNAREFAFMGQGEPGFNYPSVRNAILLTDYVMEQLGQKISRYIISTCGITSFIPALINDIQSGIFKNRITLHLSLHEIDAARSEIMPINKEYDYNEMIEYCKVFSRVTREKIGVGILMFDHYKTNRGKVYTLTAERLKHILDKLDNEFFRIDLCTVNNTAVGKQEHQLSNETANELLEIVKQNGFEGKVFSSFGDTQQSGCGMLTSSCDDMEEVGNKTIAHFNHAVELLNEAKQYIFNSMEKE